MLNSQNRVRRAGLDAVALKPREVDLASVDELPVGRAIVDYEGPSVLPDPATLDQLAELVELRVTVPVRADGFDPLGDDRRWADLPGTAAVALVAGNPTYLRPEECRRAIAPRLAAALDRSATAWVGTEGIERIAMATGATQFELLAPGTERRVRDLRTLGFDGEVAVYAPTVLTDDADAVLDALGAYAARRRRVAAALPAGTPIDSSATGRTRDVLLSAATDYGIVGSLSAVRERVERLHEAGVDHVVGYPPRGLDEFRGSA